MNLSYCITANPDVVFPRCGPLVGPPERLFLAQPLADPFAVGEAWAKVLRCGTLPLLRERGAGLHGWPRPLDKIPTLTTHQTKLKLEEASRPTHKPRQLSTTDILAPATMKNAAKCDT